MATVLKSLWKNPKSPLLFKTAGFAFFLALLKISGFSWWPVLFFIIAALLFFFPLFQTTSYFVPFVVFLFVGLLFIVRLPEQYFFFGWLLLSALFYLLSGIKNLIIVDRLRSQLIFVFTLLFLALLMFFESGRGAISPWIKIAALLLIEIVILNWLFKVTMPSVTKSQRRLSVGLMALVLAELSWAVGLLPIGYLSSAALATLTIFIMLDLILRHFQGILSRRVILTNITIGVLLTALIFITSRWKV